MLRPLPSTGTKENSALNSFKNVELEEIQGIYPVAEVCILIQGLVTLYSFDIQPYITDDAFQLVQSFVVGLPNSWICGKLLDGRTHNLHFLWA